MKEAKAVEVVLFKTQEGITEEQAEQALLSLNPILERFQGYISRQLSKNGEGLWHDMVLWESMEEAKKAAEEVMKNETALQVFSIIDQQSMQFYHFTPVAKPEPVIA